MLNFVCNIFNRSDVHLKIQVFVLPSEKKAAYGALDKWNAWETESQLIAAAKYLKAEESMEASNLSMTLMLLLWPV